MQRRQGAPVDVKTGHGLGHVLGHDVERHVLVRGQHVGEPGEPTLSEQEGARLITRLQRPADDLLPLGDEQAALGLD